MCTNFSNHYFQVKYKKRYFSYLILIFSFIVTIGDLRAQCDALLWSDEFNGSTLDASVWSYETGNGAGTSSGPGWGNNELEYYTNGTNNSSVTGGNLVITPKYQPNYNGTGFNYTSARIVTKGKKYWKYGRMEAKIMIPSAQGVWPAFWMLPENNNWPYTGEIDIMEAKNKNPTSIAQTLHYWCSPCGNHQYTGTNYSPGGDFSSAFHIYAVEWMPGTIKYSIDGVVTATYTPASLTGGNAADWTFDEQNFHILFNVAVGGNFTGTTPVSSDYPVSMLVDYVRVYSTPATLIITGNDLVFSGGTDTYSVNASSGETINWTVPAGASIVSGQGTNTITVNWTSVPGGNVGVSVDPDGGGACVASILSYPVKVINNVCALLLDDFEGNRNISGKYSNGNLTVIANPGAGGSNTSATVGKYNRNSGSTYDILGYKDFLLGNPDDFRSGLRTFTMDVRTNAPAGTPVTIEFDNSVLLYNNFPSGRHSQYTAVTGTPNVWTKLSFVFASSPDLTLTGIDVDRIQILFHPNSNVAGEVYYFDNFTAQGATPVTSGITGVNSVCSNQAGIPYSVSATANSTYNWTVPTGSLVASGQGSNAVMVNFGSTSGNVMVTETNSVMCSGLPKSLSVTLTGSCLPVPDFSASTVSTCIGNSITFTDQTTGKIGGETYSWNFGTGATPATSSSATPVIVNYSSSGQKTITLTVTNANGSVGKTKTNYVNINNPPTGCLLSDDFNDNLVQWITPNPGAFSHSEAGTNWTISNSGYSEWENFTYSINNGTTTFPLDFSCPGNKPIVQIRAKASSNALLRMTLLDAGGKAVDNITPIDLELTTSYIIFSVDYSTHFRNYNGPVTGLLDSTNIDRLQFYVNPGYSSFPITGINAVYNTRYTGTIDVDWIGIGNNCSYPSGLPVTILDFSGVKNNGYNKLVWNTANEFNNDYFEVERSDNGVDFLAIGKVEAKRNNSVYGSYEFTDVNILDGISFYRLRQVDSNGNFTYSKIISISEEILDNSNELEIYPNPSDKNEFSISWKSNSIEDRFIEIFTSLGQKISQINISQKQGIVTSKSLNIELNAGIYLIQFKGTNISKKLIIN